MTATIKENEDIDFHGAQEENGFYDSNGNYVIMSYFRVFTNMVLRYSQVI